MVLALIIVVILATVIYPGFFEFKNIRNLLAQNTPVGIVAVGMTFVILGFGFDLSVGAIFAIGAVFFAKNADALGLWGAAGVTLAVAVACGIINALIVTKLRVNPLVATLGTGSSFSGLAYIYSKSAPITPSDFDFGYIGSTYWLGWPVAVWALVLFMVVGGLVLASTSYGRSIYAIGGNDEAARLSGMRVDLIRGSTYVISAICSAVAGMLLASRLGVGQADMGASVALDAIAIVVIGGTSLTGGQGAMWRSVMGLLILATLSNVFNSLAVSSNVQSLVKGIIIVGAVALDVFVRSRR
ncbi:ABC transporter permease [Leisingera daeponensis]|nr:ABC transporter permease [Leisingera daeponensis]